MDDANSDGKVKGASLFPHVGWSEVDSDAPWFPSVSGLMQRSSNTLLRLTYGIVGKSDNLKRGQPRLDSDFYFDAERANPKN
jgi:hypothetical protein